MNVQDPRLRFRVWVDREMMDEAWINACDPQRQPAIEDVWARHQEIIRQAHASGRRWHVEIYDPSQPEEQALRFGTDESAIPPPSLDLGTILHRIITKDTG